MDTLTTALQRAQRRRTLPSPAMLRHLRERVGLTQDEIAAALGVTRVSVARYELGCRTPRGAVLDKYLDILARLAREGLGT